jgi:UDP-N-acetylmuramate--alanine ligase
VLNAFFVEERNDFVKEIKSHLEKDSALILMGARDPGLDEFAKKVFEEL